MVKEWFYDDGSSFLLILDKETDTDTYNMDTTGMDIEKVKNKAIAFYEKEHELNKEDRLQLYVFFEQQTRRMLLGFAIGVTIGSMTPFLVRRKGQLINPALPILGAILGGSIIPGLINQQIYKLQVNQFKEKFGDNSKICQMIEYTPDPISKSIFWSNYFKKSANDIRYRMKDPREVEGSNKFFQIEESSGGGSGSVPPYGRPEFYTNEESEDNDSESNGSSWDNIRKGKVISNTNFNTTSTTFTDTDSISPREDRDKDSNRDSNRRETAWERIRRENNQ